MEPGHNVQERHNINDVVLRPQYKVGRENKGVRIGVAQFLVELVTCTNLETRDKPQQIVAQRLLSCLQYPIP